MKIKNYRLIKLILILIILSFLQCVKFTTDSKTTTNSNIKNLLTSNLLSKSQTISSSNLLKNNLSNLSHEKTTSTLNLTTKHCNSLCAQCSLNDFNYCTLCQPGMIFYNFNCFATCPDGTFLQESTRKCLPCSENCPICWGSESSMCGTVYGVFTQVVELEKEIIEYFSTHIFVKEEIDEWLNNLKIIFANKKDEIIYPLFVEDNPLISVYLNDKISAELPIGTFGLSNGIFIPIPPYINKDKKLIESHWVYKQGMFDGITWHSDYFPRLPSFIKYKGTKDKIYIENNGYWVYDLIKQWIFINSNKIVQVDISIPEKLGRLNNIKFDLEMDNKKRELENYVRKFFDDFSEIGSKVFGDLKKGFQENEENMIVHMEKIKTNVSKYFNEAPPEKDKMIISQEESKRNSLRKGKYPIKRYSKEQIEEMDKKSGGLFKLKIEKGMEMGKFYNEVNRIDDLK